MLKYLNAFSVEEPKKEDEYACGLDGMDGRDF